MAHAHEHGHGGAEQARTLAPFAVAVLTLSDRGARGERADESGPALCRMVAEAGGTVAATGLLPDDKERIAVQLRAWCAPGAGIDLVLTTGGTGFSVRDVTPEATLAVAERLAPGIPERMRAVGGRQSPLAALSRGVCGICGRTLILNLPGSVRGARESLAAVLDVLPHGLAVLKGEAGDCGRM